MTDKKVLGFDPLERAESIIAWYVSDKTVFTLPAETREQIRDLIALSQAKSLAQIAKTLEEILINGVSNVSR